MKNYYLIILAIGLASAIPLLSVDEKEIYFMRLIVDERTGLESTFTAKETPDAFIIHIKNPKYFFYNVKNPSFMVTNDGNRVLILNPKDKTYIGDITLPIPASPTIRGKKINVHFLNAHLIEITVPKDKTKSSLYYWWHRKKFEVYDPLCF